MDMFVVANKEKFINLLLSTEREGIEKFIGRIYRDGGKL